MRGDDFATIQACKRVQRWYRRRVAQRAAQADLKLLREWDALLAQVGRACTAIREERAAAERYEHAVLQVQMQARWQLKRRASARLALQCAARRRLARQQLRAAAALRLQCASRQKLARKALNDAYWAYAFGLLHEESAVRLQRWWRALRARRAAQADLHLLRGWDEHIESVRRACELRSRMVVKLQRRARLHADEQWLQYMGVGYEHGSLESELNPFSKEYVGPEEHRRRVEAAQGGKLRQFGNPSRRAMARSFPAQLATLFNTLRFVDAINSLLSRRLVDHVTEGEHGWLSAPYSEIMAWGDHALQARSSYPQTACLPD